MYVCGVLGGKAQMCHFAGNDLGHGVPQTELTWMQCSHWPLRKTARL